jgi:protein required for attachment to host cells
MTQTWILVGDGSHARLFHSDGVTEPWSLVRKVDREHSREKTADSHEDRGEHAFARQLVGELETARQSGTFAELVLVAPPKFLGQLRGELGAPLATCVVNSFDADYTHMSQTELMKHIDLTAKTAKA